MLRTTDRNICNGRFHVNLDYLRGIKGKYWEVKTKGEIGTILVFNHRFNLHTPWFWWGEEGDSLETVLNVARRSHSWGKEMKRKIRWQRRDDSAVVTAPADPLLPARGKAPSRDHSGTSPLTLSHKHGKLSFCVFLPSFLLTEIFYFTNVICV
jgi:hypothetical protein